MSGSDVSHPVSGTSDRPQRRGPAEVVGLTVRSLLVTMVVVLPSFWTMGQIGRWWTPPLAAVILAVMLAVSLPRAVAAVQPRYWLGSALGLLVSTVLAGVASVLVVMDGRPRIAGAIVFAVLAGVTVWLRRFRAPGRAVGLMAGLPLMAVLVAPMPSHMSWSVTVWVLVSAVVAGLWAGAIAFLSVRVVAGDRPRPGGSAPESGTRPSKSAKPRVLSSTRMALQQTVAVGLAFLAAQWVDASHVVWPVLTALIVLSNNRGRGDVLWKGAQRLVGALIGTAAATAVVGLWPAGDVRAIVVVFALIALAAALRPFGYVYWAACVTAGLAFLYGYLGQGGMGMLSHRLIGIVVGGVIAIVVAWFLLPVRTIDVVRSRIAAVRRAMSDVEVLRERGEDPTLSLATLQDSCHQLSQLLPATRAARVLGIGPVRTLATTVQDTLDQASQLSADLDFPENPGYVGSG